MSGNGAWSDLVSDFQEYTRTQPTTDLFRLWAAISMIGGALERRVWVRVGTLVTCPNLYVLLVAHPGVGKSIINIVKEFWEETIDPDTKDAKCFHVAANSVTKASLIDEIDDAETIRMKGIREGFFKYQSLLVAAEEFEVLLPHYDPEFIGVLNDMYNNRNNYSERRRTGNRKHVELTRPQLNILGGVQPAYFVAHFKDYAWQTGFVRRCIMAYSESRKPTSLLETPSNTPRLRDHILRRLSAIFDLYGEAKMTDEARDMIDEWHKAGGPPAPDHSRLQFYKETRSEFIIKLSLISAISRAHEMTVHPVDVQRGIGWLVEVEKRMPDIFRAMKTQSDDLVLQNLHQIAQREYIRLGKQPVPLEFIAQWLSENVVAERITRMIDAAHMIGAIEPFNGDRSFWIPRPKHLMGSTNR